MLIKISTPDDPSHDTWINPLAVAAIKRNKHSGESVISMIGGQNYASRSDDPEFGIVEEISQAQDMLQPPQREL